MQITAYKCSECNKIFEQEIDCISCYEKDLIKKEKKIKEERLLKIKNERRHSPRLNAESIHDYFDRIAEILKNDGIYLDFSIENYGIIGQPKISESLKNNEIFLKGTIAGKITIDGENECPKSFGSIIIDQFSGMVLEAGSQSRIKFSYYWRANIKNFPILFEKYLQLADLEVKEVQYFKMKKEKEVEFKEYLKLKHFSDITWAVNHFEEKRLNKELKILEDELETIVSNIRNREKELYDEEEYRQMTYVEIEGFDKDLYDQLKIIFRK